jgi:hypothetical protein
MNGAAAKATRREIRRAFGDRAIDTLTDHESQLRSLGIIVDEHRNQARAATAILDTDLAALRARVRILEKGTFLERLRWFLTGRV